MPPPTEDAPSDRRTPGEPVPGTARAVREVEALPDGRRVTWYASTAEPDADGGAAP